MYMFCLICTYFDRSVILECACYNKTTEMSETKIPPADTFSDGQSLKNLEHLECRIDYDSDIDTIPRIHT